MTEQHIDYIVADIGRKFPTFGGGRGSNWNPVAAASRTARCSSRLAWTYGTL
jgi:hypothetical protein